MRLCGTTLNDVIHLLKTNLCGGAGQDKRKTRSGINPYKSVKMGATLRRSNGIGDPGNMWTATEAGGGHNKDPVENRTSRPLVIQPQRHGDRRSWWV